jgi:putative phosphoesterase
MKIGVVSDTHSMEVPQQVLTAFRSVDLIIHAGDFADIETLKLFQKIKEVKAVWGNADGEDLRGILPAKQFITAGKFRIGVYHGEGPSAKVLERVQQELKKEKLDAVVFGHSHQAFNETIKGVLYFNPGSPNDIVTAPYCSYGILEITDEKIAGRIVKL